MALAWLCERYWFPLYAYVRRKGHNADAALDITQAFFVHLLERDVFAAADRERGRMRDFLLTAINHFLLNEHDRSAAKKRGGIVVHFSLNTSKAEDCYRLNAIHEETPEKLFARCWALDLLERVLLKLKESYGADKGKHFEAMKSCLVGNASVETYSVIGQKLNLGENAVKVAVYRLRKKYRALLLKEIEGTLAHPERYDDVKSELSALFEALALNSRKIM